MKIKITTFVLLLASLTLFAQDDWNTLEQDEYAINYPTDWEYSDQKPQPTIQFMLLSDESSVTEDQFRENINLTSEALGGRDIDAKAYTKISVDMIKGQLPSAKIVSNTAIKLDGRDAQAVVWSADFGNGMVLKFKQILTVYNDKGYVLTFSSTEAEYDKYIEVGDKILNSFKLAK